MHSTIGAPTMPTRSFAALLSLVAVLALAACGGSDTPAVSLNPAFAGTWDGTTTVTIPGAAPITYQGQLVISLSGATASVSRVCLDGSGSLTMTGSGNAASWAGSLVCAPVAVTCSGVAGTLNITLTAAAGALSNDTTTLTAQGSGTATACGSATTITFSFVGT